MRGQISEKSIITNLQDAGCSSQQIENFIKSYKDDDINKQILLLKCQRCLLLEDLHIVQKKIECLDYLIHMLKQNG
ncbi:MAG: hypothetical protein Q4B70_18245 [Lachnospiraceae bacterium]|nr:hypothetical protein [Lachnospiraceae bacterium]